MKLACITGGDDRYFLQLLVLIASFKRRCPQRSLYVCDFGLDPRRATYLARHATVLPTPASLQSARHVWDKKASLLSYLRNEPFDALIWFDTDMMLVADVPGELLDLVATTEADLFCCPEGGTLGQLIRRRGRQAHANIDVLVDLAARMNVAMDAAYLNSGFFFCQSRDFLERWQSLTLETPLHVLHEQNAFNLIAHAETGYQALTRAEWNCFGADLDGVARDDAGGWITEAGGRLRIIHCTTDCGNVDRSELQLGSPQNGSFRGSLRMPRNPAIKQLQLEFVEFVVKELPMLNAHGLLERQ